jgi:hypothetical protein
MTEPVKTSDLPFAAYLLALGVRLRCIEPDPGNSSRAFFCFENAPPGAREQFNAGANIGAKLFYDAFQSLRREAIDALRGAERERWGRRG